MILQGCKCAQVTLIFRYIPASSSCLTVSHYCRGFRPTPVPSDVNFRAKMQVSGMTRGWERRGRCRTKLTRSRRALIPGSPLLHSRDFCPDRYPWGVMDERRRPGLSNPSGSHTGCHQARTRTRRASNMKRERKKEEKGALRPERMGLDVMESSATHKRRGGAKTTMTYQIFPKRLSKVIRSD